MQISSRRQGWDLVCHEPVTPLLGDTSGGLWSLKAVPKLPTELLLSTFITLDFLPSLASQTVVQTKRPFITAFLTAGHYLITTSGSHIVCWRLFQVLDGRRRNEETYTQRGWGGEESQGGYQQDGFWPPALTWWFCVLTFSAGIPREEERQYVSNLRHFLGQGLGDLSPESSTSK